MDLQRFADSAQERTEEATPRKKEEARKRGQVFKSMEVISAATLLATWGVLELAGPFMTRHLIAFLRDTYALIAKPDFSEGAVGELMQDLLLTSVIVALPVLGAALVSGLLANYLQVGFVFSLEPLKPQFSRINPAEGFKRIFSRRSLVELLKGLLKITIIGWVAYTAVAGDMQHFAAMMDVGVEGTTATIMGVVSKLFLRVGLATAVLAVFDYAYQRFEFNQQMKMTKQEVKEEMKQTEGSPEIKAAVRRRQREMARRRMMEDVKRADVVVTNPTHYAVALRYRADEGAAPRVLAKGQGFVAQRIKEIAKEAGIPTVENVPLARALHASVDVGKSIPPELYQAVAEVLAFVYRLKGRAM
jgi:flagellar biosynthetic protein FlhB